jgi:hypothetical protein
MGEVDLTFYSAADCGGIPPFTPDNLHATQWFLRKNP